MSDNDLKILRLPEVMAKTGLSRSTIYAYMTAGNFPSPIQLGLRAVGWLDADIEAWIKSRKSHGR
ncbi:MAG: AlpA family transcriptional regulator [Alphaproteobacteria bacterium]|nr:AlpA family transcriptional regulator [Alphaproteobacteria bacterium]